MPGPLSVLIIEDDEVQSEYLAEWIIRKLQIVVDTVTTGESALESISQNGNQYDAVLVDQVLPGIDGIETIRRLKIILPGVHIIMLTGGDEDVGLEALQLGAYRYILKPINPKEIEFLLRHIAEIRQLEQQLAQQNVSLRESETRRKDLENLVRASEAVTQKTASGPRSVLEEVARSARNLTGADFVVIYPYDPARKHFFDTDSVVADGLQEPRTLGQKPREMGLASIVRNTKEIVVQNVATGEFDQIGHDSLARLNLDEGMLLGIIRDEKFIVEEGVQAFVGLSLETGEPGDRREVGVLYIDFKEPHRFSSNELYLIRFFGNLMATAIVNAQLLEDERQLRNQAMTLREVSSAISEANTLKDVGNKILTGLRSVVGFEKATIQLIEGDRRRLLAFSGFERKDIDRRLLRPISQDALIRRVISQATPSILPQVEDDPEWQKRKKTADIASWAGVPIVYSDETLGLITLDHSIPGYYTSSVENVLTLFASQAAIAVKKAQLIKDLEERVKDLAAHAKISQGLSSHESIAVHDMALLLHREARKLMNLNNFFVALYDIDRDSVTFELAIEDGREVPTGEREWRSRTKGTGLTERVIKRGHLLYIPNRVGEWRLRHRATDGLRYGTSYADWKKTRDPRIMAKSWLGVPIKLGKEVLGVIGAQNYDKTNAYDVFDRQVLSTIADQLGVALVRLWLERQNKELLALIRIGQTVSNLRIDEILDTVYEQMNNIMILSNAQVQFAFYDEDREEVIFPLAIEQDNGHIIDKVRWGRRESEFRNSGEDEDADGIVMLFKPRARRVPPGLTEYVIRTREPLIIEADFEQRTHELELVVWPQFGIKQRPTTSWLGVPMIVQDHVVGIISIQSLGNEPPVDAAQMRVLMTVAGQAAIAVENARLHQHLEQRAKELEKVNRALETANRRIAEREAMLVRALIAEDFVHRVNNLAGTIPIWVDLIRSEMSSDNQDLDATRNYLDEIQRDIDGLLRAAEELKKPSREQIVNVGFMLQSMLRQLRIQNRRIDAIDMVDKTLDRVVAVPSTLASALSNVIDNAADSIPKGAYGRVTVEAKNLVGQHGTKNVSIKISDDGEGISDIDIENLFIPFYSTKGDERGYGLWRSKSIIESLGGSIVLKSRRGIGTEVTILLPAAYERPE